MSIGGKMSETNGPQIEELLGQLRDFVAADKKAKTNVTQEDLERVALQLGDRMDGKMNLLVQRVESVEALLQERLENIQLKLAREQDQKIDEKIQNRLPEEVARLLGERRRGSWAFVKRHTSWVASLIMLLAAIITFWMATQGQDTDSAEKVVKGLGKISR